MDHLVTARISFRQTRDFNHLLIITGLLELLTLRLYRFWGRTVVRRHLWAAIRIGHEPLEYTGDARELLLGSMTTLSIMLPLLVLFDCAVVAFGSEGPVYILMSNLLFGTVYLLAVMGDYLALRYRLSRTLWRGIGAGLNGSIVSYALQYIRWAVAFLVTGGLSVPWACAALARYRFAHMHWGDFPGRFTGRPNALLHSWMIAWALWYAPLFVVAGVLVIADNLSLFALVVEMAKVFDAVNDRDEVWMLYAAALWLIVGMLASFYFRAKWLAWCLNSVDIGPIRCSCTLEKVFDLPLSRGFVVVAGYVLFVIWMVVEANLGRNGLFSDWDYDDSVWGCLALVAGSGIIGGILWRCLIEIPFLENLLSKITLENFSAADLAEAAPVRPARLTEGVWDMSNGAFI